MNRAQMYADIRRMTKEQREHVRLNAPPEMAVVLIDAHADAMEDALAALGSLQAKTDEAILDAFLEVCPHDTYMDGPSAAAHLARKFKEANGRVETIIGELKTTNK